MPDYTQKKTETISESLRQNLKISGSAAKKLIDTKNVFVNNKRIWIAGYKLRAGDKIETPEITMPKNKTATPLKNIKLVYEDTFFVVAVKPTGINSNLAHSLESLLKRQLHCPTLQAIHRLDKETSGLLLLAKNNDCFEKFKVLFKKRVVKKIYFALAAGEITKNNFIVDSPVDNKPALSKFNVLKKNRLATFLKTELLTGRKHQIRVHLKEQGYPLLGDTVYFNKVEEPLFKKIPRQMLHAGEIQFQHPYTGKELVFSAPLPEDFKKTLRLLKLAG